MKPAVSNFRVIDWLGTNLETFAFLDDFFHFVVWSHLVNCQFCWDMSSRERATHFFNSICGFCCGECVGGVDHGREEVSWRGLRGCAVKVSVWCDIPTLTLFYINSDITCLTRGQNLNTSNNITAATLTSPSFIDISRWVSLISSNGHSEEIAASVYWNAACIVAPKTYQ